MSNPRFCIWCGAEQPHRARFCPVCGRASAATPATAPVEADGVVPETVDEAPAPVGPAPASTTSVSRKSVTLVAVITAVLLVIVAWALLTRLPFRARAERPVIPATATIAEAPPPAAVPDLGVTTEPGFVSSDATAAIAPSLGTPTAVPQPTGITHGTALGQGAGPGEITSTEAMGVLASRLRSLYPNLDVRCVEIRNQGYGNVGYTLELIDSCRGRSLDVWRVDSRTRELFRRRADGRFLAP